MMPCHYNVFAFSKELQSYKKNKEITHINPYPNNWTQSLTSLHLWSISDITWTALVPINGDVISSQRLNGPP